MLLRLLFALVFVSAAARAQSDPDREAAVAKLEELRAAFGEGLEIRALDPINNGVRYGHVADLCRLSVPNGARCLASRLSEAQVANLYAVLAPRAASIQTAIAARANASGRVFSGGGLHAELSPEGALSVRLRWRISFFGLTDISVPTSPAEELTSWSESARTSLLAPETLDRLIERF